MLIPPAGHAQGGAFTHGQAREAGISARTIRRRLTSGTWIEWLPQGYMLAGSSPPLAGRAMVATLLTNGVASHASAACLLGLDLPESDQIHVTTPRRRHENLTGLIEHRMRLDDHQIIRVDEVPLTNRLTTILDLCSWMPEREARSYFFRCIQQRWVTESEIVEGIANRPGRHGIVRLRSFLDYLGTAAHSGGERELHLLLDRAGLHYRANVQITLSTGAAYELDVLIDNLKVVIELDGRAFHTDATAFQRDRLRQNALVNAGFTILRFTVPDVIDRPRHVLGVINDALAQANLRSSNDYI